MIKSEVGSSSKKQRAMIRCEVGSPSKKQRKGMKYIPGDIIEQIQLRLPVKSIIRFRLVSKLWYTVSSDASFLQKHVLNFVNKNPPLELAKHPSSNKVSIYEKGVYKCDLWTPNILYSENGLVGSWNGIVCMFENEKIVVFNPVTRESISLPNVPSSINEPSKRRKWGSWDFGFNPSANEHKIIHFYQDERHNPMECGVEVFTLGKDTSSWRQIEGVLSMLPLDEAIGIGATMYWKSHKYGDVSLLFFDLSEEKFGQIKSPKEEYYKSLIMDLNGQLNWVSINPPCQNRIMNLWTLNAETGDNKSNWILLRSIRLWGASIHRWSPLSLWHVTNPEKNKKRMIIELGNTRWNEYYCVDLTMKNGCVEKVQSDLLLNSNLLVRADCAYVESLLPLP